MVILTTKNGSFSIPFSNSSSFSRKLSKGRLLSTSKCSLDTRTKKRYVMTINSSRNLDQVHLELFSQLHIGLQVTKEQLKLFQKIDSLINNNFKMRSLSSKNLIILTLLNSMRSMKVNLPFTWSLNIAKVVSSSHLQYRIRGSKRKMLPS